MLQTGLQKEYSWGSSLSPPRLRFLRPKHIHVFVFHFVTWLRGATDSGLLFPPPFHFCFAPRQTSLRMQAPLNFGMECLESNYRLQAVVLLSSEPRAASEKVKSVMQINGKKEERLGRRDKEWLVLKRRTFHETNQSNLTKRRTNLKRQKVWLRRSPPTRAPDLLWHKRKIRDCSQSTAIPLLKCQCQKMSEPLKVSTI